MRAPPGVSRLGRAAPIFFVCPVPRWSLDGLACDRMPLARVQHQQCAAVLCDAHGFFLGGGRSSMEGLRRVLHAWPCIASLGGVERCVGVLPPPCMRPAPCITAQGPPVVPAVWGPGAAMLGGGACPHWAGHSTWASTAGIPSRCVCIRGDSSGPLELTGVAGADLHALRDLHC